MGIKGKASSLLEEFKAFAFKGNIVDMAIGVIIGGAFDDVALEGESLEFFKEGCCFSFDKK